MICHFPWLLQILIRGPSKYKPELWFSFYLQLFWIKVNELGKDDEKIVERQYGKGAQSSCVCLHVFMLVCKVLFSFSFFL